MKILLLGYGKTTISLMKMLSFYDIDYFISAKEDINNEKYLKYNKNLFYLTDIDYVIKSPGIKKDDSFVQLLLKKFVFISELDLLYLLNIKTKVIAVTGSNGKTTCVLLLKNLLEKAKYKVLVCGNSHDPISDYFLEFNKLDFLIIELSSFQLTFLKYYHPFIATIINLEPNHLDSYKNVYEYYQDKMNIFKYQTSDDYFIYNPKLKLLKNYKIPSKIICYDANINTKFKYYEQYQILSAVCKILSLNINLLSETINDFVPLKFRENIVNVRNITFINDAKSTSVAATNFALKNIEQKSNIILIIGGKDKKIDYEKLNLKCVKYVLIYGEIKKHFQKGDKYLLFKNLNEAFKKAISIKLENKIVLFSPATSSFDQYNNYQERGIEFDNLIKNFEEKSND